ncbi:malectin domain-containing carbohydrate-binding protein [Lacibacter sp. H407]|uniref:malectin domain-containing carbohydrate-binding protein n=1 Tax=Lacibacter sp. H407 TaxID=3133423 RepID=UPI0030BE45E9
MLLCVFVSLWFNSSAQRQDISLNENWFSITTSNDQQLPVNTYQTVINSNWKKVNIPHNWDQYEGYRRLLHGNRHGDSWYRKTFTTKQTTAGKRFFLFFEGVGSYAIVYLNNKKVGEHIGGRTTFTLDVTDVIKTDGTINQLAVRAYHPSNIQNLPWVCGGCSDERGFSEGSQPMGIFRPVHLIATNDVRIEPFGIHAWADLKKEEATLSINTTFKNYSNRNRSVTVVHQLMDAKGKIVKEVSLVQQMKGKDSLTVLQRDIRITKPNLWSVEDPYLYKIVSIVKENNLVVDKTETEFGFRTINWKNPTNQFFLNGKPVFINGIAEYEHLLGQSHAFSHEQILSRFKWLQSAGFNAFRDGHQPHNLLYGQLCDQKGILWWTQLSAHVWYDSPEFRKNFKQLLKEWVIERRNSPSIILWGLQNESKLPEDFAKECTELIRSLDPTASTQRLVTTCNGGTGTDWDVPQNWTGTYGGDPATYDDDVKKQVLIGEYGAWRTIDLHTEGGFVQNGILSEDRMVQLMEQKVRLAESVKDSSAGQFFWLLTSHDNPGRVQGGEGLRELDRIGPVNYKGLLTPWEEPTDAYYMFRSNYAPKESQPMVYIVSHTWPNRWMKPGIRDSIYVYSNCDEVELFNDINGSSLGKQKKNGIGTHFQWNNVNIQYNVLYAVGYVNGGTVARDTIVLNHLPKSPNFKQLYANTKPLTKPTAGYQYIYRVNCGGGEYKDENGNTWLADKGFATSWTKDFPEVPINFASQRRTFSPIKGTKDWKLFQDFRYGKDKLSYEFALPDGEYLVEFYFVEPWLGIGGGINATGMRLFDVAINDKTVLKDLDISKEVGVNAALKKTVKAKISSGKMVVSFPESKSGQATISAIAIASINKGISTKSISSFISGLSCENCKEQSWLDIGDKQFANGTIQFNSLPSNLYGADWIQLSNSSQKQTVSFVPTIDLDVFLSVKKSLTQPPAGELTKTELITNEDGGTVYNVYRKRYAKDEKVNLTIDQNVVLAFLPVNKMQPAYDLKPITPYRSNVAIIGEGVVKDSMNGRWCTLIKSNAETSIQWPVQTGVGDIYSITVKYYYPKEQIVKAKLQLFDAGGNRMMEEAVQFTFTRVGKWNQFTVNTGSQINAGNYVVKLVTENGTELAISGIEIQ